MKVVGDVEQVNLSTGERWVRVTGDGESRLIGSLPDKAEKRSSMGDFRVVVEATGGHGCQREVKEGGQLQQYCHNPSCPDCAAREFVRLLKRIGTMIRSATLIHWPGTQGEVQDDLVTGIRKGNF